MKHCLQKQPAPHEPAGGAHASELSVAALPIHRVCMALNLTFPAFETLWMGKPATHQPARIGKVQSAELIMSIRYRTSPFTTVGAILVLNGNNNNG